MRVAGRRAGCESARRQIRCLDAQAPDVVGQLAVADQAGAGARQGRRCLDAVAALAGQPAKAFGIVVEADDRRAVRGKGPETRPAVEDRADLDRGGLLQPIDADRDIQIVGPGVHRLARRRIGGRDEKPAGVRLEIELFADIVDQRPGGDRHRFRRRDLERGAPLRRQPDRIDAGHRREPIGPCASRVDDDSGSEACLRGLDDPASAAALDRFDARIGEDLGATLAGGAQEAPVQPVDVEIARVRLDDGAGDIVATQRRHKLDRRGRGDFDEWTAPVRGRVRARRAAARAGRHARWSACRAASSTRGRKNRPAAIRETTGWRSPGGE